MTRNIRRAGVIAAAATLPLGFALAITPALADGHEATISVLHGIPEGAGADVVDVYANGNLLIDDFTPGTLETMMVPAGSYDLAVYADGTTPDDSDPVLAADGVEVPGGVNATVTANLDAEGAPALNVFVNDIATIAAGEGRLTVRHIAAAPAVDVLADGAVLFANLTNPNQDLATVPAGDYEAAVNLAGTDTTAIGPAPVSLAEGANTIVYAWGSAEEGNLALATQVITGLGAGPDNVPAGGGSTTGTPMWALALAGVAAIGLVGAGVRLSTSRN